MIKQLLDVNDTTPLPVMCERLGEALGLGRPAPMPVLLRAIEDPGFATDLITCRSAPAFLTVLFDDPRTRAYERETSVAEKSAPELAGKAAAALTRWARAGFSTVALEVLERRENACLSCPHLKDPQSLLQKMVPVGQVSNEVGSRLGRKICGECGCVATKKMRLPTEHCPSEHPVHAGLSRWGEPMVTPAGRS